MPIRRFQGNKDHPQHLSVGAILVNDKNEVCCHHVLAKDLKGYWVDEGLDNFYLLMRETLSPNETLEAAVARGLTKEFGATAEIVDYVGSLKSSFRHEGEDIEKTTLYFLCRLKKQDESKRDTREIEGMTKLVWKTPSMLIPLMKKQGERFGRTDVDESVILERYKKLK